MNHQSFRSAFEAALRGSGLRVLGLGGEEQLDLHKLDRIYRTAIEPIGGQDADPFFVTAWLSWRWSALQTARANTTEEDVVTEMFGRDDGAAIRTEIPWVRVDITLKATLPYGKPMPMPAPPAMQHWFHETMTRLEQIEPLTPEEQVRQDEGGRLAVLAWQQAEPHVHALCRPSGDLMLDGVELGAWQAVEVPRTLDDPDQEADPGPEEQLTGMFGRTRAALSAWMQALDHLRGCGRVDRQ
ncbi:MAG TPA: hypothetical protein VFH68_25285 [Polyangia bacterium]|jgi:hypothetical protein|nr:hypothetical protein [Polyangia bacterium]